MAVLTILQYPDSRLYQKAAPVVKFDADLKVLTENMAETMYAAPGIGLAATQVDVHQQLIVIDISAERNQLQVFINPAIVEQDGLQFYEEGCLSVPGVYEDVERAQHIKVRAQSLTGKAFELEADGLLAVCIQHEMDHLQGKVFVDYLSRLKQNRIKARMQKQQRRSA
jgi:peptide deformylase